MELFHEESVRSDHPAPGQILYRLYLIGMIVFIVLAIAALMFVGAWTNPYIGYVPVVLFGALAVICFFVKDRQIIEYDYSFLNGTLTVSKIINNKTRKELISCEVSEWNAFGAVTDANFAHARQDARVVKAYLNADHALYYAVYVQNNRKVMIILEPGEELLDCIRQSSRTKFRV